MTRIRNPGTVENPNRTRSALIFNILCKNPGLMVYSVHLEQRDTGRPPWAGNFGADLRNCSPGHDPHGSFPEYRITGARAGAAGPHTCLFRRAFPVGALKSRQWRDPGPAFPVPAGCPPEIILLCQSSNITPPTHDHVGASASRGLRLAPSLMVRLLRSSELRHLGFKHRSIQASGFGA